MMKRLLIGLALILLTGAPAFAGEHDAVMNDTDGAWETTKDVIDRLDPSVDTLYILKNSRFDEGELAYGLSAALYELKSGDKGYGSLRIGYNTDRRTYSTFRANLVSIGQKVLPESVLVKFRGVNWATVGKYLQVGAFVGYDWNHEDVIFGPEVGARIKF